MLKDVRIEWIDQSWDRFGRLQDMLFAVLYQPFGVDRASDWYHEGEGEIAVALAGGRLVGSARLLGKAGDHSRQLRQVAVEPAVQRRGIGRALVEAAERRASTEGTRELWLNARDTAYRFYASLGYGFDGEPFESELTRIPHRRMSRQIGPPPS